MPPPTCKCAICGTETTKRQTLMVAPYGRICRSHPEVEQFKDQLAKKAEELRANRELEAKWKQANDNLNIIMGTELLRTVAGMYGIPMATVVFMYGYRFPESIRYKIIEEAMRKGPLTSDEMTQAVFMAAALQKGSNAEKASG